MENILVKLSNVYIKKNDNTIFNSDVEGISVLHVVSEMYNTGGHSKIVQHWTKVDSNNTHFIYATQMDSEKLGQVMQELSFRKDVRYIGRFSKNQIEHARELHSFANKFDRIVLHINRNDIIPIIAFSSIAIPVYFMNHADHCYWSGIIVTDVLLQIREVNIAIDENLRQIQAQKQYFLPIPINLQSEHESKDNQIRYANGVEEDDIILLTTGSAYKFKPFKDKNLFTDVIPVLDKYDNVKLWVVGIEENDEAAIVHPKIKYFGRISYLQKLEKECDIYLETLPFSSFTALLETIGQKKAIQLMYNPHDIIKYFPDSNGIKYPTSSLQWQNSLDGLINDEDLRFNNSLVFYDHVRKFNSISYFTERIKGIYKYTDKRDKIITKQVCRLSENEELFHSSRPKSTLLNLFKKKLNM